MKFNLLLLCIFFFAQFSLWAQENKDPEEFAANQTKWMKEDLLLTGEQESKVKEINREYALSINKFRNEHPNDKNANMQELKRLDKERDNELKNVLTNAQFSKYTKIKDKKIKTYKENKRGKKQGIRKKSDVEKEQGIQKK